MKILPIKKNFFHKHIISINQFDRDSVELLFEKVEEMKNNVENGRDHSLLKGKIVTLLFFEPSSRTFSSFSVAAKKLGAGTCEYQNPLATSSAVKGETLEDTINVFENYSDAIIIRHPQIGAVQKAAEASFNTPIINAGDGIGEHPTQALMDLYTIRSKFGRLNNLTGLMAGDLLYGRTIHSLLRGLSLFPKNTVYLLSPKRLRLSPEIIRELRKKGLKLKEISSEKEIPKDCYFWYWTRVQKERFNNIKEYEELKMSFIITPKLLKERGNKSMIIMHPLPRVGEIKTEIDKDGRAIYLTDQIKNGLYTRMALLAEVLNNK